MRSIIAATSLFALLLAVGCNLAPHHRDSVGGGGLAKDNDTSKLTVESLVEYLNRNAACVKPDQAVTCRNVMINVDAEAGRVGIDCKMICQAPRNFRMSGVALSQPVVEIGSNDKEFWFWSREIKPPYLYHCSYEDLSRGVKVPFPFEPDMVVKALGLAPYDRNYKQYTMNLVKDARGRNRAIELIEQARSPDNRPIQKITVFNFTQADPPNPQIIAHIVKDERGKVVCEANIRYAQRVDGINGPIIPRIVDFNWPEQKMKMNMRIENPSITAMPTAKAATVFNRRDLQWQSFDLATQRTDGAGLQQAGGVSRTYRN